MRHPLGQNGPSSDDGVGVGVVGGKIYAIADNYNVASALTAYFNVYDADTNTWTEKAPIPNYVGSYVITVCQNKIFVISGTTQVYDPTTDAWTMKTSILPGSLTLKHAFPEAKSTS